MKSRRLESPLRGWCFGEGGSLAIFKILRTFSSGMPSFWASSSSVGSRPTSLSIWREVRTILLIVSIM